jgi:hypothetical protein
MLSSKMKLERGTGSGTSSYHSLNRDAEKPASQPAQRLTTVDDAAHDHANLRAMRTIAASVFPGATFYRATIAAGAASVSSGRFAGEAGRLLR